MLAKVLGFLMNNVPVFKDAFFLVVICLGVAITKEGDKPGAEKKKEAIKKFQDLIKEPGGIDLPEYWLSEAMVGLAIDVAVTLANMLGWSNFFKSLKPGSQQK